MLAGIYHWYPILFGKMMNKNLGYIHFWVTAISAYGEPELESNKIETQSIEKQQTINNKNYHLISSLDEIDKWIEEAEEVGEVAVDTETTSLDPHQADLVGISLCSKIGKACYIPVGHISPKCLKKDAVIKKLKKILEDPSIKKIGQNIKFDFYRIL